MRKYRRWSVLGLVILIILQTYWVIGTYLVANLPILSDDPSTREEAITQEAKWSIGYEDKTSEGPAASTTPTSDSKPQSASLSKSATTTRDRESKDPQPDAHYSDALKRAIEDIRQTRVRTHESLLALWLIPVTPVLHALKRYAQPNESWQRGILAKYAINILQTYILPPLYGWIGALAYVVRRLVPEINARTYYRANNSSYNIRISLGVLAGLAIAWFFPPGTSDVGHLLQALSPLALAFLAGYSVELLFSAMDRILEAFSSKTAKEI